jgi:hypothetical protein
MYRVPTSANARSVFDRFSAPPGRLLPQLQAFSAPTKNPDGASQADVVLLRLHSPPTSSNEVLERVPTESKAPERTRCSGTIGNEGTRAGINLGHN